MREIPFIQMMKFKQLKVTQKTPVENCILMLPGLILLIT